MDHDVVAREMLRALRGERSQAAFSRRLRYRTNIAHLWESGRRTPFASRAFSAAARVGVDLRGALERFWAFPIPGGAPDIGTRDGVAAMLRLFVGPLGVGEAASRAGANRFTMSRWLSGRGEPRLGALLRIVDAWTDRGADFVSCFVDPAAVPSLARVWKQRRALAALAFEHPWSEAVAAALELPAFATRAVDPARWASERLGISIEESQQCVAALRRAGLVRTRRGVTVVERSRSEHRLQMEAARTLKLHWHRELGRRFDTEREGMCSYLVLALSEADAARARQLQLDYYDALLQLAARARNPEVVCVALAQLTSLGTARPTKRRRSAARPPGAAP